MEDVQSLGVSSQSMLPIQQGAVGYLKLAGLKATYFVIFYGTNIGQSRLCFIFHNKVGSWFEQDITGQQVN